MSKIIYHYNEITGVLLGADVARESPMEPGIFLVPAHATEIEPPAAPSGELAVFDVATGAWSLVVMPQPVPVPPPTLAEIKTAQWGYIKGERDLRKAGGFKVVVGVEDKWFHSDEPSRSQYGVLLTTAVEKGLPVDFVFDAAWKTMDGTKLPMTVDLVRRIRDAGLVVEAQNFNNAETHKAAMEISADPAAYDFSAGWSQTFVESLVQV